jgi:hypothetical protein
LFVGEGSAQLDETRGVDRRLSAIRAAASADFPLDDAGVSALLAHLADHVLKIHHLEQAAVQRLQRAMGG